MFIRFHISEARMAIPEVVRRLALHRFTATQAATAAGLPATRLAVRINEGRVPSFPAYPGAVVLGRGARRSFGLPEVYVLRLVEAHATGAGIDVGEAFAIVDSLRGVPLRDAVDPDFETPLGWAPQEWPAEWLRRDLTNPVYFVAVKVPGLGWRTRFLHAEMTIGDALALAGTAERRMDPQLPRHLEALIASDMAPMGALIINLTRELVAVDAALAPLLAPEPGADD